MFPCCVTGLPFPWLSSAAAAATSDSAPRTRARRGKRRGIVRGIGLLVFACSVSWREDAAKRRFRRSAFRLSASRLRVHDHVGDVRALPTDSLLDLAGTGVGLVEPARTLECERQEGDQTVLGAKE